MIWFRTLVLIFGSTTYSFTVMLAVFLLGIGAGSLALGWIADRIENHSSLIAVCFLVIGGYTIFSMHLFPDSPVTDQVAVAHDWAWSAMLQAKFLITLSFLMVPTVFLGFLFTHHRQRGTTR